MMRAFFRSQLLISVLLSAAWTAAWAQPTVGRVEPPNWWIGISHDPMLLLSGEHLSGAQVACRTAGVSVTRTKPGQDGHSLFVWIHISPRTAPGDARFAVRTAEGNTEFKLPLARREHVAETGNGIHPDDVVYLIMPDRFADGDRANDAPARGVAANRSEAHAYHGGDLKGIEQHLSYFKELGVTTLWLTPWWKNSDTAADYHGYHVTNFYGVDDHFGSMGDLQSLVRAAHANGLKVVSDYVGNHLGPDHPWAKQPPLASWLHGTAEKHIDPKYDFWPLVDVHAVTRDRRPVVEGWFAGRLPDINPDDPQLGEYLADNAIWWMESAHFDGYRLDTFPYSSREFWGGWHRTLREVYPHATSVAEVFNFDPVITSFYEGGRTMRGVDSGATTVFDFPMYQALRDVLLRGKPATQLVDVLRHDGLYQRPEGLYTFLGNHDVKRFLSEPGADTTRLKAAFALLFTLRGIPQIYYGDEIAMSGGDDPENRHDFPGGFPGDTQSAFEAAGRTAQQQELFSFVQQLARMRREHPALQGGELRTLDSSDNYYAFLREQGSDRVLVVLNSSTTAQSVNLERADTPLSDVREADALLASTPLTLTPEKLTISVAPLSVSVYRLK